MSDNYQKIVQENLRQLYGNLPIDLSENLPAEQVGEQFHFNAFGEKCVLDPERIILGEEEHSLVLNLIISVYALNANSENCVILPLKSLKEFPDSVSHVAASAMPASKLLVPHVAEITNAKQNIIKHLTGKKGHLIPEAIFPLFFTRCQKLHCAIHSMRQMTISLLL